MKWLLIVFVCTGFVIFACHDATPKDTTAKVIELFNGQAQTLLDEAQQFSSLIQSNSPKSELQLQFFKLRAAYKKVEWLAEYYFPYTAKKINGPALPEVEADEKAIVINPEGFQVIEEDLFTEEDGYNSQELFGKAKVLQSNINRLKYLASIQETTDSHIIDALRLEMFRIITLGITGFDSPVAARSLPEAAVSLQSVRDNLSLFHSQLSERGIQLEKENNNLLGQAVQSLESASKFDSFDRSALITKYLNPSCEKILLLQQDLRIPVFTEPRPLRAGAKTLFAEDVFNADYYAPGIASYSNPEKVKLGEKLFYDGILSGDGKRSCATCHQPAKAFTDGLATSFALNGKSSLIRNSPTLLNAALQPALFYDMRVNYLEDQAKDVISNKDEMHGSLSDAIAYINRNETYRLLFKKVYNDEEISETQLKNSIAAYIRSLVAMNSRFDEFMRGKPGALNQTEIDGFNLFTGKAKCATCHFIPLFNGSNPPLFDKTDAEVIGVPGNADSLHPVLDTDAGKFNLYRVELHRNAFKTPTLRNITLTAPYMHKGVYKTLEEVIEFYNRGGGVGSGLKIENQTLPPDKLNLSEYEKKSLVAFMNSLTDTCVTRPGKSPEAD